MKLTNFRTVSTAALVSCFVLLSACSSDSPNAAPAPVPARDVFPLPGPTTTVRSTGVPPLANKDHWHAAYGVYDCDRYLPPLEGSELPDPTGIHTHADGLIHIHPFVESAAGARAVLELFTGPVGLSFKDGKLVSANSKPRVERRDGDLCPNGKPGRVRVLQFTGKNNTEPTEVSNPLAIRLQKDQAFAFVFAPEDQLIGPPLSLSELDAPRDQAISFEMTPERKKIAGKEPLYSRPQGEKPAKLVIEDLEVGTGDAAGPSSKVGVKFVLGTWDSDKPIDTNWLDSQDLLGLAVGRKQVMEGFEQGVIGMKVGGLRRIVIPPSLGFGANGAPPAIGPNETLVLYVRLVAVEAPRFSVPGTTTNS